MLSFSMTPPINSCAATWHLLGGMDENKKLLDGTHVRVHDDYQNKGFVVASYDLPQPVRWHFTLTSSQFQEYLTLQDVDEEQAFLCQQNYNCFTFPQGRRDTSWANCTFVVSKCFGLRRSVCEPVGSSFVCVLLSVKWRTTSEGSEYPYTCELMLRFFDDLITDNPKHKTHIIKEYFAWCCRDFKPKKKAATLRNMMSSLEQGLVKWRRLYKRSGEKYDTNTRIVPVDQVLKATTTSTSLRVVPPSSPSTEREHTRKHKKKRRKNKNTEHASSHKGRRTTSSSSSPKGAHDDDPEDMDMDQESSLQRRSNKRKNIVKESQEEKDKGPTKNRRKRRRRQTIVKDSSDDDTGNTRKNDDFQEEKDKGPTKNRRKRRRRQTIVKDSSDDDIEDKKAKLPPRGKRKTGLDVPSERKGENNTKTHRRKRRKRQTMVDNHADDDDDDDDDDHEPLVKRARPKSGSTSPRLFPGERLEACFLSDNAVPPVIPAEKSGESTQQSTKPSPPPPSPTSPVVTVLPRSKPQTFTQDRANENASLPMQKKATPTPTPSPPKTAKASTGPSPTASTPDNATSAPTPSPLKTTTASTGSTPSPPHGDKKSTGSLPTLPKPDDTKAVPPPTPSKTPAAVPSDASSTMPTTPSLAQSSKTTAAASPKKGVTPPESDGKTGAKPLEVLSTTLKREESVPSQVSHAAETPPSSSSAGALETGTPISQHTTVHQTSPSRAASHPMAARSTAPKTSAGGAGLDPVEAKKEDDNPGWTTFRYKPDPSRRSTPQDRPVVTKATKVAATPSETKTQVRVCVRFCPT